MFIRDLVAKIGFRVDTRSLDRFDKSISRTKVNLRGVSRQAKIAVAAITALTGSMLALTVSTANTIRLTEQLSKQIGISADELRVYDRASQAAGFRTDQFTNALLRFDIMLGQAKISAGGTSKEFEALGINTRNAAGGIKDTVTLLTEASRKLIGLKDQAKQTAISYRLFGTTNIEMARFMGQSNDAMSEQIRTIRDLTFEIDHNAVAASEKFSRSWSETKTALTAVKEQLGLELMPVFNDLLDNFKSWFKINKDLIRQNISTTVSTITKVFSIFGKVVNTVFNTLSKVTEFIIKPIKSLIEELGGLERVTKVLGSGLALVLIPRLIKLAKVIRLVGLAAFSSALITVSTHVVVVAKVIGVLIARMGLLGIAIRAIGAIFAVLIVEDLLAWVTGNESAIGDVLGSWEDFKVLLLGIWSDVTNGVIQSLGEMVDFAKSMFDSIISSVSNVGTKIREALTPDLFKSKKVETTVVNNVIKRIRTEPIKLLDESIDGDAATDPSNKKVTTVIRGRQNPLSPLLVDKIERVRAESRERNNVPTALMPVRNNSVGAGRGVSGSNSVNNITQSITENITINVPQGTTSQQSTAISAQVADEVQKQFQASIVQSLDAISMR